MIEDEGIIVEKRNLFTFDKMMMIDYLNLKLKQQDWHGVQDAASDIRDIEAKIEALNFVLDKK